MAAVDGSCEAGETPETSAGLRHSANRIPQDAQGQLNAKPPPGCGDAHCALELERCYDPNNYNNARCVSAAMAL